MASIVMADSVATPVVSASMSYYSETEANDTIFEGEEEHVRSTTQNKLEVIRLDSKNDILNYYTVGSILGEGAYGQVAQVTCKFSQETKAIKMLEKTRNSSIKEFQVPYSIDHPCVLKAELVFETDDTIFAIFPLFNGRDLFDFARDCNMYLRNLTERDALRILKEMARGIDACHVSGFCHLDVKLENLLFRLPPIQKLNSKMLIENNISLIDFGSARPTVELLQSRQPGASKLVITGTSPYCAPEIFQNTLEVKESADIWSLGCSFYILIAGERPFEGDCNSEIVHKILDQTRSQIGASTYSVNKLLDVATPETKSLLLKMMDPNPACRPTARQIIAQVDYILQL